MMLAAVFDSVSTHSRPKAAAPCAGRFRQISWRFNTQPPEGGCGRRWLCGRCGKCFNTQPPEGGCASQKYIILTELKFQHTAARRRLRQLIAQYQHKRKVSTHSRPKAAATSYAVTHRRQRSFNTQPPEGGCAVQRWRNFTATFVSTHSRPKAAARS